MPATLRRPAPPSSSLLPARRLQQDFAAARVSFTWLGVRKTLSADQKTQAAQSFGAEGPYISAAKKLWDTRHEAFQRVTSVKSQITHYWKGRSLPYPEPGVRLIRQDEVQRFDRHMNQFRQELLDAVESLDQQFENLKSVARDRLGSLYNPADYPPGLRGVFDVEWEFPSVEPPDYLLRLNPQLYQQEKDRVSARFEEAVRLAEEAFASELAKLVTHLVERLGGGVEGERKVFRDSAVNNLREFFERFRSLSVHSSPELDRLVETARKALDGAEPQAVRDSEGLRQQIATQLSAVQSALDGMLVDQPRRRVLRQDRQKGSAG